MSPKESRTLWSCGLIPNVLDWEVGGLNLTAARILFCHSLQEGEARGGKEGSRKLALTRS